MNCVFGLTCFIYVCRVRSESTPGVLPKATGESRWAVFSWRV